MSFDLFIFVPQLPNDITRQWEQRLLTYGLRCMFYPGYHPDTWHDSFAPVRVEVIAGSFPAAHRYGSRPMLTELELWDETDTADPNEDNKTIALRYAPTTVHPILEQATRCIYLRTAASRTPIQFRLQCFAAATLALMTDGLLDDPQAGVYLTGDAAIQHAIRLTDQHDQRAAPEDWRLTPFTDWSAWDGELPNENTP